MLSDKATESRRQAIEKRFYSKVKQRTPTVKPISNFVSMQTEMKFKCLLCSSVFYRKPALVLKKTYPCIQCSKIKAANNSKATRISDGLKKLKRELKIRKILLDETTYKSNSEYADFKCLKCNSMWKQIPKALLGCKHGCKKCSLINGVKSNFLNHVDEYINNIEKTKNILTLSIPKHRNEVVKFRCLVCDTTWEKAFWRVMKPSSGCPSCGYSAKQKHRKTYSVKVGKREINVEGYERFVVKDLYKRDRKISVPVDESFPRVTYRYSNKTRKYTADFYLPKTNELVEVKSLATIGLLSIRRYNNTFQRTKAKRKAVIKAGFVFTLLVLDVNGNYIPLPEYWHTMKKPEVIKYLQEKHLL